MQDSSHVHPHDVGLSDRVIRKRKNNRYLAHWMITFAVITAIPGWIIYGRSFSFAVNVKQDSPAMVILAWGLLIISSATLVLGLWYLLLAQVRRIAHMVGEDEPATDAAALRCHNCGWPHDGPDRFCRHCGKPLGASVVARPKA
jgi:hypothetical protein